MNAGVAHAGKKTNKTQNDLFLECLINAQVIHHVSLQLLTPSIDTTRENLNVGFDLYYS